MSKKRKLRKLRDWRRAIDNDLKDSGSEAIAIPEPTHAPRIRSWPSAWTLLVPLSLLALLLVLSFRPIMQNDFWMHLRIGEDILATLQIPEADQYSAVAQGRPFVAHEWFAGVFLALVGAAFGPLGFTLLGEVVAAGIALLSLFALPRAIRASPLLVVFGALAVYLLVFRLVIRPDLFTMLFLAVWAFTFERWRASRHLWLLGALPPLVLLWANLHGAFLFGVVSVFGMAALVASDHFLCIQRTGEAPYSRRDLQHIALVAGLCLLACLINPQGWHLPWFSLQMTTGQAFEQVRAVTEWQPTFDSESYFFKNFPYLVYAYGAWLLLLWGGLVLRLPERPVFDLAIAAAVTYLSLRQNRFIPYAAIFGFPIAVRSWHALLARYAGALHDALLSSRALKGGAALGVAVLVVLSLKRGYVVGPESISALGWGFGSRHPQAEAKHIKESGLSGVLYNERMPDGAYLIRELFPAVRPVMDMRLDVYGKELCDEYDATKTSRQLLSDYVGKYGVNLALVARGGWMEEHFRRSLGFRLVFAGDERSVLVRH